MPSPGPKDGKRRDMRSFHDTATLHLRALKAMKLDVYDLFVTAVLISKLEKSTFRDWRKYSDGMEGIPTYPELLKYMLRSMYGVPIPCHFLLAFYSVAWSPFSVLHTLR